ncbi:acyl-CoA dehydrogenase family protein [Cryptosporangium arvum]|uniref:acyl-CoA dehydrogenase family protein n=1 Tax=Cryptosporangium arvum TaxID=80871 RepID=UPI0004BB4AFA|nr:acyl-CoA dehydrogenase family protein [Cryptosporangium arvum]
MNDILAANAEKTEEQGRPTAESLRVARAAGAFALRTPQKYGGEGAGAVRTARVLAELGRDCPSTAWIAGTCLTAKTLAAGTVSEDVEREVFADPDVLFSGSGNPAGGRAERVEGGVRLTGRWPNMSGCEDATWAGLGVMLDGVFSFALVPTADLTVDRTWRVAGMRGTGSHTVVADLVVPEGRVGALRLPGPPEDRMLYGLTVLGPVVGATFGALDAVRAMFASGRTPYMTPYTSMGESPGARHWLADAARLADRAERTMLSVAAAADAGGLSAADQARLSEDMADSARDCRSAIELMLDLHGASGFATSNALQRFWRDVAVGSRHPHLNPYLAVERYGAVLAG